MRPFFHARSLLPLTMVPLFWYVSLVPLSLPKLNATFFHEAGTGTEPVREWLKSLSREDRRAIGIDIQTVQFSWPIGKPLANHIEGKI
jgi:hypothetical protein